MPSTLPMLDDAVRVLRRGGLLVYPTEGVYGIGCDARDEAAVQRLLALKQRDAAMGLISIIADLDQVADWLDPAHADRWKLALAGWPAPETWLFPCLDSAPHWLTGAHRGRLALRMPAHDWCLALCRAFGGPVVSTSANRSGQPAVRHFTELDPVLVDAVELAVDLPCGDRDKPSRIRDLMTDEVTRA
jgi:L-threonylcarbamoyladenylate synthase